MSWLLNEFGLALLQVASKAFSTLGIANSMSVGQSSISVLALAIVRSARASHFMHPVGLQVAHSPLLRMGPFRSSCSVSAGCSVANEV